MKHKHKADSKRTRIVGWSQCVAGLPNCGDAHGGVTIVYECRCGLKRLVESNGTRQAGRTWAQVDAEEAR